MKIHTWAWLAWIIAALYLISFLSLLLVSPKYNPKFFLRFSILILLLSSILNIFISRFCDTIFFTIPETIPLLGGPLSLEAAIYGFTNGLVLIGMFTIFTILNEAIPVHALVRLIPTAFQPIAVVTTIAISFVPNTQKQFFAIKEAQALRGQQLKGIKDWLPLFIPLLIGGLENAMQVAEAMTARGYVTNQTNQSFRSKLILLSSLVLIIIGWVLQLIESLKIIGLITLAAGIGLLILLFAIYSPGQKRTSYTQEEWNFESIIYTLFSLLAVALFILPIPGHDSLYYSPYPLLQMPELHLLQIAAGFLLFFPIILTKLGGRND